MFPDASAFARVRQSLMEMPKRCMLMKLYTNQGLVGYGEVRDASSRTYVAMLKPRILGENPCNVEKIFRRIKELCGDSRQACGVCAIELACLAVVHVAAATRNFMTLEVHSVDVPWWGDLVKPALSYRGAFIQVPNKPGFGIDELNEKLVKKQSCADFSAPWSPTDEWNRECANDRRWA